MSAIRAPCVFILLIAVLTLTSGCAFIKKINTVEGHEYVYTEKFKSIEEMEEKAKNLKLGTTTCPDGIREAGFDPKMKNVQELPGAAGAEYFLGTKNIQPQDPMVLKKFVDEFALYSTYIFPIKSTEKKKKFIYAYEQVEKTGGIDAYYVITCRENLLANTCGIFEFLNLLKTPSDRMEF